MTQAPSIESLLGGKTPSASFLAKGDSHEGEILSVNVSQEMDFDTRKPKFWDNGDPKWQMVIEIQTDETDPEVDDDDGRRKIYAKYKMLAAIKAELKAQGAKKPEVGGWIKVTYTSQDKAERKGAQGSKNYEVEYEAPDYTAAALNQQGDDDGDNEPEPTPDPEPAPAARRGRTAATKAAAPAARGRSSRHAEAF